VGSLKVSPPVATREKRKRGVLVSYLLVGIEPVVDCVEVVPD